MILAELPEAIGLWASELGFQQIGICDVDLAAHEPRVRAWLAKGFHGSMGYLEQNFDKRLNPALLEEQTCRVIVARMDYFPDGAEPLRILNDPALGYVSRYALGRDYHKVVRRRLALLARRIDDAAGTLDWSGANNAAATGATGSEVTAGSERQDRRHVHDRRYRAFTDSAPVLEKALGEKAGLGWIGKHSLLLSREAGSWFFLGEIYTNLPLPLTGATQQDHCGQCKACINNCPTGAIVGPKQLDARKCISYLTIESNEPIPAALRRPMGNRIFGCDDCQLYCPWNREAPNTKEPDFTPRHELDQSTLLELFAWSAETFARKTEGSAMRRINYEQWQRNLAVAIGNGPASTTVLAALRQRRQGASPMVAEHIDWAIDSLSAHPIPNE